MDDWAWEQLEPWLKARVELPVGPLFCVVNGATRGRPWRPPPPAPSCAASPARRRAAALRAAPAAPRARGRDGREGVPLIVIQRQLGHTNLGITSIYLQGIDNTEIIDTVHARRAPMVPVDSSIAPTPRSAAGKLSTSSPPILVEIASVGTGGCAIRLEGSTPTRPGCLDPAAAWQPSEA